MYKIINKKILNDSVIQMDVLAERISKKAKAGQFIILRIDEDGERIPLTINNVNKEIGTVRIIFQTVGKTTMQLSTLEEGDYILDFVGPLGKPTELFKNKKVCVIGGGVGCAISFPLVKAFTENNNEVHSIIGFRNKDLIILEDDFKNYSNQLFVVTDDGSYGRKGLVTEVLEENIKNGIVYDEVFAIGPVIMMKFVANVCKKYNVKCTVSMNPIMVDGTGMCGGCRLTVNGEMKFACVDGPDFDGALVDFDEVINRNKIYSCFEKEKREEHCKLYKVKDNVQ